jgi:hypothetical protein
VSPFNMVRVRIYLYERECIVPTWGESQLGFRVLSNWPLRDAHRLLWLAPCRPPVKTISIEHWLSKHRDCQWINWAPGNCDCHCEANSSWNVVEYVQLEKKRPHIMSIFTAHIKYVVQWQGLSLRGTGNLPRIVHYVRISGYHLPIYRNSIRHRTRCHYATSLYTDIAGFFLSISALFLRYRVWYRVARKVDLERPHIG